MNRLSRVLRRGAAGASGQRCRHVWHDAAWRAAAVAMLAATPGLALAASLYVTSAKDGQGSVVQYAIEADGTLQRIATIDVDTELAGLAVDEAGGGRVYVFAPQLRLIGQFGHEAGLLQALQPFTAEHGWLTTQLVLRRMGAATFAYALEPQSETVRALAVDAAGQLRDTGLTPAAVGYGASVLAVHPRRAFAYVAGWHPDQYRIHQFTLNAQTGAMQWVAPPGPLAAAPGLPDPLALLIHPQLEVAYLAARNHNVIHRYRIDAQGGLHLKTNDTIIGPAPAAMTLAGDGRFLYVVSATASDLVWWSIDPFHGGLELAGLLTLDSAQALTAIATHPGLPWLYVLDAPGRRLYPFKIGVDGRPRSLNPDAVDAPDGAVALAISAVP